MNKLFCLVVALSTVGCAHVQNQKQVVAVHYVPCDNHLLDGSTVSANSVVCRDKYGTPMIPDGRGGYSKVEPKTYHQVIVTRDSYGNVDWTPKIVGYYPNND